MGEYAPRVARRPSQRFGDYHLCGQDGDECTCLTLSRAGRNSSLMILVLRWLGDVGSHFLRFHLCGPIQSQDNSVLGLETQMCRISC